MVVVKPRHASRVPPGVSLEEAGFVHLGAIAFYSLLQGKIQSGERVVVLGRGGLFRYDNSDHALLTGMYAVRNFLGQGPYDLWAVNTDGEYLES